MKKEYFIEQNGKKAGAFTLEELKQKDIYDSALIWKAGWEEWKKALEVEELEGFVIITPPPTVKEKRTIEKKERINETINNAPKKALKVIGVVVVAYILMAFFAALSDMDNKYGLGIYGYLILAILVYAIYIIIKIVRK